MPARSHNEEQSVDTASADCFVFIPKGMTNVSKADD